MKYVKGDIWTFSSKGPIGIPTNGFIKSNGKGVMGAGLALQARDRFPDIETSLGNHIKVHGHCVGWIGENILSIPTKPSYMVLESYDDYEKVLPRVRNKYTIGSVVPGYHIRSDIHLIKKSLDELITFIDKNDLKSVYIPYLGCGYGDLDPDDDLWPLLAKINLPDTITLVKGYRSEPYL